MPGHRFPAAFLAWRTARGRFIVTQKSHTTQRIKNNYFSNVKQAHRRIAGEATKTTALRGGATVATQGNFEEELNFWHACAWCTFMRIDVHAYTRVCTHAYTSACKAHACTRVYMYRIGHACIHMLINVQPCKRMYVHVHLHACARAHMH